MKHSAMALNWCTSWSKSYLLRWLRKSGNVSYSCDNILLAVCLYCIISQPLHYHCAFHSQRWSRYSWFFMTSVLAFEGLPLRLADLLRSTRHTVSPLPTLRLSTPYPTLRKIGSVIFSLQAWIALFRLMSSPSFLCLLWSAASSFFLVANAACLWVY